MRTTVLAFGLLLSSCSEPKHEVTVEVRQGEKVGRHSVSQKTQEVSIEVTPEAAAALTSELKKAETAR